MLQCDKQLRFIKYFLGGFLVNFVVVLSSAIIHNNYSAFLARSINMYIFYLFIPLEHINRVIQIYNPQCTEEFPCTTIKTLGILTANAVIWGLGFSLVVFFWKRNKYRT